MSSHSHWAAAAGWAANSSGLEWPSGGGVFIIWYAVQSVKGGQHPLMQLQRQGRRRWIWYTLHWMQRMKGNLTFCLTQRANTFPEVSCVEVKQVEEEPEQPPHLYHHLITWPTQGRLKCQQNKAGRPPILMMKRRVSHALFLYCCFQI